MFVGVGVCVGQRPCVDWQSAQSLNPVMNVGPNIGPALVNTLN